MSPFLKKGEGHISYRLQEAMQAVLCRSHIESVQEIETLLRYHMQQQWLML